MLLKELFPCDGAKAELEITGVTCDSRVVEPGFAFVCIKGFSSDGHRFAQNALAVGATVIFAEDDLGLEQQILVPNTHETYARLCAKWFGNPAGDLHLIGVTGTNGKTSITYMLKSVLEAAGKKVGLIGTIQNMIGDEVLVSHNTTPNPYELNSLLSLMKAKGCTHVVMEVCSHGLDQCRIFEMDFDVAVFTNLTQDHLDYHRTMENYFEAKKKLFKMCKTAVINKDDEYGKRLANELDCKVVTYSTNDDATFSAKALQYYPGSVNYELVGNSVIQRMHMNTGGKFTVYNSMAAAVACLEIGIPLETVAASLGSLQGVKGRAEVVPTGKDYTVIIDYAHTPDGLQNILSTFKECRKNRLIVLFGCGGDRDRTKRPIMGNVAIRNADYVIVTSDNPRSEEPMDIIKDILTGMEGTRTPYKVIENRIEAIRYALSIAQTDDIIVLAGKGHETYQILKTGTIHLDEREVVADALKG